jgi:hypothetical protein
LSRSVMLFSQRRTAGEVFTGGAGARFGTAAATAAAASRKAIGNTRKRATISV